MRELRMTCARGLATQAARRLVSAAGNAATPVLPSAGFVRSSSTHGTGNLPGRGLLAALRGRRLHGMLWASTAAAAVSQDGGCASPSSAASPAEEDQQQELQQQADKPAQQEAAQQEQGPVQQQQQQQQQQVWQQGWEPPPGPTHPDWKVGVALAGAAFEAYNLLKEKGLAERHANGTQVYYLDREFMRQKLAGLLQVTIRQARSLPVADPWPGSSDPYVMVAVGDSTYTTRTILNNLNPRWEETCTLFVRDIGRQLLSVRVMDYDFGAKSDDYLGSAVCGLQGICDGQRHELDLELRGSSLGGSDTSAAGAGAGAGAGAAAAACSSAGEGGGGGSRPEGHQQEGAASGEGQHASGSAPSDEDRGGTDSAGSSSGSVQLTCRFLPFSDGLAREAVESEMGGPVLGTPGQIPLAEDWQKLLEMAGVATHAMFKPVAYVENETTNSQAWVYWNREERTACVAFRGTEQGKWKDILTDLHLVPAPLDPDRVAAAPRKAALAEISQPPKEPGTLSRVLSKVEEAKAQVAMERQRQAEESAAADGEQTERHIVATAISVVRTTAEDIKEVLDRVRREIERAEEEAEEGRPQGDAQPWVHSGFLTAYDSLRPAVLSLLATVLQGEEGQWRLYLTGHSLGGALATLCAWDCSHRTWPCQQQPELIVYNFGSPRVGNRAFADHYNRQVPSTWRIVNLNDTICTVPRLMRYAHVGHAVYLKGNGEVDIEYDTTERLGEGLGVPDVAPAVTAAVQATVAAKVPELLPAAVTDTLKKAGLEVASSGSADDTSSPAAAVVSASMGSSAGGGSSEPASAAAAVVAVGPEQLPEIWQQELDAWSMLFDGSALNEHMEPLYLENLRSYLASMAAEGHEQLAAEQGGDGKGQLEQEEGTAAASSAGGEQPAAAEGS